MKKLFPENKFTKKKVLEFLDKKGFYVVLLLCIVVIGATALFVTKYNIPSSNKEFESERIIPDDLYGEFDSDNQEELLSQAPIGVPITTPDNNVNENYQEAKEVEEKDESGEKVEAEPAKAKINEAEPAKPVTQKVEAEPAKSESAKPELAKAVASNISTTVNQVAKTTGANETPKANLESVDSNQSFIMPVLGETICVFSQDKLLYSKTLNQWRAHSGIDLAADRGTPVKAVSKGVIADVKNDPRWGFTVIIEHDNGLKTVYSNLASDEMVVQNEKVEQGDIIGCVGNTAAFEAAEEPHLHFEVWKDDELVNPEDYLLR